MVTVDNNLSDKASPLFLYFIYLYEQLSTKELPRIIEAPSSSWEPYFNMLYDLQQQKHPKIKINKQWLPKEPIKADKSNNDVYVGFSGGKDSAASALLLKEHTRYNPVLVHLNKINRSYYSEDKLAENFANNLEFDYLGVDFTWKGKIELPDHPIKNHLILAYMIHLGMAKGVFRYHVADYVTSLVYEEQDEPGINCCSDVYAFFLEFEKAVRADFYPEFSLVWIWKNQCQAHSYLFLFHRYVLNYVQSCLCPDIFRKTKKDRIARLYPDAHIPKNSCLTCYKCAIEYILLYRLGLVPKNIDAYKEALLGFSKKLSQQHNLAHTFKTVGEAIDNVFPNKDVQKYRENRNSIFEDLDMRGF